ncbi:MAG: hypothetical protein BWY70_01881 [Bacteroidetes bacterium ADurb.Bin408]|nr:MAG: hypothetical protein BWY70_01881 [Bacteroidetes bacterium ADurb.Bin408]
MSKEININLKPKGKIGRPCKNEPEVERPGSMLEYYDKDNIITGYVSGYKNKSKQYGRQGKLFSSVAPVRSEMVFACKAGRVTRNY